MTRASVNNVLNVVIALSILVALGSSVWHYLIDKDYLFVVESPCDPSTTTCHYRDCSNPDDCPIGEYEYYTTTLVASGDFELCSDNTCRMECEQNTIACEVISCNEEAGDTCVFLPSSEVPLDDEQPMESASDQE